MDKIVTENLFLLEFLVDKVELQCNNMPCMTENICVSVQFLDNAPLDICEDDFQSSGGQCGKNGVKSGKSCLFSLTSEQANEASKQFDVYVNVFQKAEPGVLPDKIQIGCSLISIVNLFNELIQSVTCSTGQSPTAKSLKDKFDIRGPTCDVIGCLSMYVRMSCFGKLIVTQFQMNLEEKTVLFKDKEGHSLYRYKKARKSSTEMGSNGFGAGARSSTRGIGNPNCPQTPCYGGGQGGATNGYDTPCKECGRSGGTQPPPCAKTMSGAGGGYDPCNNGNNQMQQYRGREMQEVDPPGNYEEIGASMGGNKLVLRVHKDNKVEQIGDGCSDTGSCACTVNRGNKAIGGDLNTGNVVVSPCSGRGGGGGGNAQLGMSPGCNNNNRQFDLQMGGCNGGGGVPQNNISVLPPSCTPKDGSQGTNIADKDVFILRIGKKSEGANKKNNLELELCTPKGPELKPLPQKCTKDTQFDPLLSGDGKGKGGKGGKKGGKGGKKGGKGGKKGGGGGGGGGGGSDDGGDSDGDGKGGKGGKKGKGNGNGNGNGKEGDKDGKGGGKDGKGRGSGGGGGASVGFMPSKKQSQISSCDPSSCAVSCFSSCPTVSCFQPCPPCRVYCPGILKNCGNCCT